MDAHRHLAVSVKIPREEKFAEGGLATMAKHVAHAGVGGDTMVIHVNKPEFDQLRQHWGEPTINPHTGMPQFTPFYKQDWFAPVAGILGSLVAGPLVGGAIGSATGLGATASNALGGALVGGGLGALSNGGQGALLGALAGGATPLVSDALTGSSGGTGLLSGLFGAGSSSSNGGTMFNPVNSTSDSSTTSSSSGSSSGSSSSGSSGSSGLFSKGGALPYILGGLVIANALGKSSGPSADSKAAAAQNAQQQANFNKPSPVMSFQRSYKPLSSPQQYYTYGMQAQPSQFQGNQFPQAQGQPQAYARGGLAALRKGGSPPQPTQRPSHFVQGPGDGRSDDIPARLSDGEYVMDGETVSMLGNGSSEAGAQRLDEMRANLRKHKGAALARGKFSPDAKRPEQYMRGGRS